MRVMSWLGACKTAVVIRSHRFAQRFSPLRTAPLPGFPRAIRRGGLSMIALAVSALPAAPAALASSAAAPDWTQQAPATSPPARFFTSMAYDAATRTIVLFGGRLANGVKSNDTWTWDGSTWTKQGPATSPHLRDGAAMAYDAATRTVVLFSGPLTFSDTWTWNGSTWTKQAPAAKPPARHFASMAYDAATGAIVLFGGATGPQGNTFFGDTWTWDGSTWTKQAPAAHPSARASASMAYDAATRTTVLFGGTGPHGILGDTWTWDGSTWTKQAPTAHPSARASASMAYDAATGTTVLFGGFGQGPSGATPLSGTWTWDGSTWTKQAPTAHPSARESASMAYDAATGDTVLFGGVYRTTVFGDTWTWGISG